VSIAAGSATGTFKLSLNYLTFGTFTTGDIAFGADAATVQAALLAASNGSQLLSSQGTVSVTKSGDNYDVAFGGGFAGRDLKNLQVQLAVDSAEPSGSFTIEYDGNTSAAIAYSSNTATMAARIQAALEALGGIGAGNVAVSYDASASDDLNASYRVTFQGSLANRDIADFSTHFGSLDGATATPYEVRKGQAAVAEEQTLAITTSAPSATFTLTFGGDTTAAIDTGASSDDVQAALDAAFGGDVELVSFSGKRLTVRFAGALAGTDVALMTASVSAEAGSAELEVVQQGSTTDIAATPARDVVVDYSDGKTALTVPTGTGSDFTFDLDGADGALTRGSGHLVIDAVGFFRLDGNFALDSGYGSVTLADGAVVEAQVLTLGGNAVSAFAGVGGGRADRVGLDLAGVDFALALVGDRNDATRHWTSLQASADTIALVGIDGLTLSADTLAVSINQAAADSSVIDYAQQNLEVATGPATHLTLDLDGQRGELLEASGHVTIDAFGFFQAEGGFAVTKSTETVTLGDASEVDVDLLTLGASNVEAFAGLAGGTSDAIGLQLQDVSFALALMREQVDPLGGTVARSWSALHAQAGRASFEGVDGLTIAVSSVEVQINQADANGDVVDLAASPVEVAVGPGLSETLDFDGADGALLRASGAFEIDAFGFFQASGNLALEKRAASVAVADNPATAGVDESGLVDVDLLTLGGSGLDAFVGVGGGTDDALGLAVGGVDFALVMASEAGLGLGVTPRSWSSLQATAQSVALVGIEGVTIAADSLAVQVNNAATDGTVIDYATRGLAVKTGPADELALDMDGADGALLRASGHLTLDVLGFVQADGDFAVEKKTTTITLADAGATQVNVDLLTIGASGLDAFAGVNGGTDAAIGLALTDVDLGLALMREQGAAAPRSWTSLKATAGSAA